MAPPGRRRNTAVSIVTSFLLLFLLFSPEAGAVSAVLGIDLGTEYIKAVLVKPGIPLDIVLTKDSKRKEAAAIGFKPSTSSSNDEDSLAERLYGGDALAAQARFPEHIYPNLKPLLGSGVDTRKAEEKYTMRYPGLDLTRFEEGNVGFKSKAFGTDGVRMAVEELLAMELTNIKLNAENMAGSGLVIRNAVITVPPFFTADEKRAVELAADLAGLNVMSIISDGLSIGLHYATSREFPNIDKGNTPEYHLVYDMGAGSTTATVLKLQARNIKDVGKFNKTIQEVDVIGTGWDRSLGGDVFNDLIVKHMIQEFTEASGARSKGIRREAVYAHGRTMAKLWKEAERLRQVLSANSASSAGFESLFEDEDFRYKLSRTELEDMVDPYVERVGLPLQRALQSANLQIKDLNSIVMHGGAIRTPFVQNQLELLAGDQAKLRSNVNADEAAAFGAAFKAAGLSPSFRVKDIKSNDVGTYTSTVTWSPRGKPRSQNIFSPSSAVGTVKSVPFNVSENFDLSVSQKVPSSDSDELVDVPICNVRITNLTESVEQLVSKHGCARENVKTSLSMRLDPTTGLPEVASGSSSCEVDQSGKKGGVMDGVKGLFGFGGDKEQQPLNDEQDMDSSSSEASTTPASSASGSASSSLNNSASTAASSGIPSKSKDDTNKIPKMKVESINLAIEQKRSDKRQPSAEELSQMKSRLTAFDKSDTARRVREETFNGLEAFTYKARDMLTEQGFMAVSSSSQRETLEQAIAAAGEWLHSDEGSSADIASIKDRLKILKDLVRPIQKRKTEAVDRGKAVNNLRSALNTTDTLRVQVQEMIDKAASASASSPSSPTSSDEPSSSSTLSQTPSTDPLDALEDESFPTTPSSSTPSFSPTPSPEPVYYDQSDIDELQASISTLRQWLEEKTAAQDALDPSEDPAFLSSEANQKAKELNELMTRMVMKRAESWSPPPPKGGGKKGAGGKGKKAGKEGKKEKERGSSTSSSLSSAPEASASADGKEKAGRKEEL